MYKSIHKYTYEDRCVCLDARLYSFIYLGCQCVSEVVLYVEFQSYVPAYSNMSTTNKVCIYPAETHQLCSRKTSRKQLCNPNLQVCARASYT